MRLTFVRPKPYGSLELTAYVCRSLSSSLTTLIRRVSILSSSMFMADERILTRRIKVVRLDDKDLHTYAVSSSDPYGFGRTNVNLIHQRLIEMRYLYRSRRFTVNHFRAVNLLRLCDRPLNVEQVLLARINLGSVNRFVGKDLRNIPGVKVETKNWILPFEWSEEVDSFGIPGPADFVDPVSVRFSQDSRLAGGAFVDG